MTPLSPKRGSYGILRGFRLWAPLTAHVALACLVVSLLFDGPGWGEELRRRAELRNADQEREWVSDLSLLSGDDDDDDASLAGNGGLLAAAMGAAGPILSPPQSEQQAIPKPVRHRAERPQPPDRSLAHAPPLPRPALASATSTFASPVRSTATASASPPPLAPLPSVPTLPGLPGIQGDVPARSAALSAAAAPTGQVPLTAGWNLVSLPVAPASTNPAAVLAPIAGRFDLVHAYDACAAADPWHTYDPAATAGNTLTALDHRIGFWIRATAAATLPVSGTTPAETTIQLCPGWNLIGYPLAQPRSVPNALHSIAGKYLRVYGYDPNDPADPWEVFDVGVPDWANDLQTMLPGRGYWVFATEATTLTMSNTGPPPDVAIASPAPGTFVTAPTAIVGTVASDVLDHWTLAARRIGETGFTTFATGNAPVDNAALATFDPSLQVNGLYEIELTATDFEGRSTAVSTNVIVEGRLKVGNFTVSFTDLEVPVSGIPIQVIRTYDSRDRSNGDFGAGWTLSLTHARLQESDPPGDGWQGQRAGGTFGNYCIAPLHPKTVTITLPDDTVYRFRPTVTPACQAFAPPEVVTLGYAPLPGTTATLTPIDQSGQTLVIGAFPGRVQLLDEDFTELADPNRYKLTLKDGRELVIDQSGGLVSIKDLNGNQLTFTRNGIGHSSGKTITFERDTQGRITKVIDPAGQDIEYGYSAAGDLIAVSDRLRQVSRYGYDNSHYLLTIEDPRGIQPLRNEYDDQGRLVRYIDPDGHAVTYSHDLTARQELVTDRLGHQTLYEYNPAGDVVRVTDPQGAITQYSYDVNGNTTSEQDPLGGTTSYSYDGDGNGTSYTLPAGASVQFTYINSDRAKTIIDARGNATTFEYDSKGNILQERDRSGGIKSYSYDSRGNITSIIDALGCVTQRQYDSFGNLTKEIDPLGHATTFTYDVAGNRLAETTTRALLSGVVETLVTRYRYDAQNRWIELTNSDGSQRHREYDAAGQLSAEIDELGRRLTFSYDTMGHLVRTTYPDHTEETLAYDAEGRRIRSTDRLGRAQQLVYEVSSNPVQIIYPDGNSSRRSYDLGGHLAAVVDERGNTTRYRYDLQGRLVGVTDALSFESTFAYDPNGNLIKATDARGHTTRYEYDSEDRRIRTVLPDGNSRQTVYDALGRAIVQIDEAGKSTRFSYDCLGRLKQVVDALGQTTVYEYDDIGNLIRQTDAEGRATSFEYDARRRLVRKTLPMGQVTAMAYDAVGNLVSSTDASGSVTTYAYNLDNRLVRKSLSGTSLIDFSYNPVGLRTTETDRRGAATYTYDLRDRLVRVQSPEGNLIEYQYDEAGNRTALTTSGGTTAYQFDALNRLTRINDPSNGSTTYTFDPIGNRATAAFFNGIKATYAYDSHDRLTRLAYEGAGGTPLSSYVYTFDALGRRTQVENQDGSKVAYSYDDVGRLVEEHNINPTGGSPITEYSYDRVGNRLSRTRSGTTTSYSYDADDRLINAGDATFTYDARGNMVSRVLGNTETLYEYDSENRLLRATARQNGAAAKTFEFTYDADGNRIKATIDGANVTSFLVDSNRFLPEVLLEANGGSAIGSSYIHGDDLVEQQRNGILSIYLPDGTGSIRQLTDSVGNITDTYSYDAFGVPVSAGSATNPYLYNAQAFVPDLGLYYLRARYYDPGLGRFLTPDPVPGSLQEPVSRHQYIYANNDPVNRSDPSGLFSIEEGLIVSAIAGLTATIGSIAYGLYVYGDYPPTIRGTLIHEAIFKYYRALGYRCNNWVATSANPPIDRRRPDCRYQDPPSPLLGEVYEIKSLLEAPQAGGQLYAYIAALQQRYPQIPWRPGLFLWAPTPLPRTDLPQFPFIVIHLSLEEPGIIAYWAGPDYPEALKVGLKAFALSLLAYFITAGAPLIRLRPIPTPVYAFGG